MMPEMPAPPEEVLPWLALPGPDCDCFVERSTMAYVPCAEHAVILALVLWA